jgi:NitT/TauT family transport system permease protein
LKRRFGLLLLVAWQVIVMILHVPEYLLPAPTAILATFDRSLAVQFGVTFTEALAGFLIASVLAFAIATLFARFHTLEEGLSPIAIAVKTTPIVAIAQLLVIWLGSLVFIRAEVSDAHCYCNECSPFAGEANPII